MDKLHPGTQGTVALSAQLFHKSWNKTYLVLGLDFYIYIETWAFFIVFLAI